MYNALLAKDYYKVELFHSPLKGIAKELNTIIKKRNILLLVHKHQLSQLGL